MKGYAVPHPEADNKKLTSNAAQPNRDFEEVKPGKYRHYKGKEYEVLGVAKHSETLDEYVVYRALYDDGQLWIRSKEMFLQRIKIDGQELLRFKYLDN